MESSKAVIGEVKFCYAHVFEPTAMEEGQTKKYSASIIISKNDKATIAKVTSAFNQGLAEAKAKHGGDWSKIKLADVLHDGDDKGDDAYEGSFYLSAKSIQRPVVLNSDKNEILDKEEFYSGCLGKAGINFYGYTKPKKGIAVGLNAVMKTKEGERLGGGRFDADDFDDDMM
jgi:hypothetical protein